MQDKPTHQQFVEIATLYIGLVTTFNLKHALQKRIVFDHICFKCEKPEAYEAMRAMLEAKDVSVWMQQEWISSRRVAYFQLKKPINECVNFVELQDVETDVGDTPGFHHLELYPAPGITYSLLIRSLQEKDVKIRHKPRTHHPTHDITLENGFIVRLSEQSLAQKIGEAISKSY